MSSTAFRPACFNASLYPCLLAAGLSSLAIVAFSDAAMAQANSVRIAANQAAVSYTYLHVNPTTGNDASNGSPQAPLRTITKALESATANTIIVLGPGTYSEATGEQFPIVMKSGVTLQGQAANRGQNVIISGSGTYLSRTFARQNITLLGANRAGLQGVTVTNAAPQGYGLWIESSSPVISDSTFVGSSHDGVSIVGNSAPILKNNYVARNGANGLTIYGTSRPQIIGNTFENTGFGINIAQDATPYLVNNHVKQNKDGILVQGQAQPILRNNKIHDNQRDGLVVISQARPHLGNTTDPGKNQFSGNGSLDINAAVSRQSLPSFDNQFGKTSGDIDRNSTIAVAMPPVRQVASRRPVNVKAVASVPAQAVVPSQVQSQSIIVPSIGSDTTDTAKPAVTQPPIDSMNLPLLRLPRVPASLSPKLRPVASPLALNPTSRIGNTATSPRSLPQVPTLRVSQPSLFGGTASDNPVPANSSSTSIPIAVPLPEGVKTIAVVPTIRTTNPTASNAVFAPADILPVPSGTIPVGNVGSAPSVWRAQSARPNLRYRVYVPQYGAASLAQLRTIIPGAFNVRVNGQPVIQAGAFNDRTEAEGLVRKLNSAGLPATVDKY